MSQPKAGSRLNPYPGVSGKPAWLREQRPGVEPLRDRLSEASEEDPMKAEPKGYWTRVFDQAATLLKSRPELNGDSAYWLARRMVDLALIEERRPAEPPLLELKQPAPDRAELILAP